MPTASLFKQINYCRHTPCGYWIGNHVLDHGETIKVKSDHTCLYHHDFLVKTQLHSANHPMIEENR